MFGWMSVRRIFFKYSAKKILSLEKFFVIDLTLLFLAFLPLVFAWGQERTSTKSVSLEADDEESRAYLHAAGL